MRIGEREKNSKKLETEKRLIADVRGYTVIGHIVRLSKAIKKSNARSAKPQKKEERSEKTRWRRN